MKQILLYDTVKKSKVEFAPIKKNKVKIYICGPTVYDNTHLGHARSAVVFDLLHRVFLINGYEVQISKNFTDIDDKILEKMKQSKQSLEEITNFYINAYKKDMKILNILPTHEPKATEHIEAMIEMIGELLKKDMAYTIDDGVYLDTSKDSLYGTLSNRGDLDESNQSRLEQKEQKRNAKDFALWKIKKDESVAYEASFGKGRPGWHIECSAMIQKTLAYKEGDYQIDIHCGGADLLFPHHENEASQTRCAFGQNLAKYWLHNGFVNIDGEKMSKSLGNSFFLKDVFKSYAGEVVRFYLLSTNYRNDLNFNEVDLIAAKKRLDKFYRLKKRVYGITSGVADTKFKENIIEALNDDLNSPKAISLIDEFVVFANDMLDKEPKNKNLKSQIVANIEFVGEILGVGLLDSFKYFQFGVDEETIQRIQNLIEKRKAYKEEKDFESADKIREELSSMQIAIMDTPQKTLWEKM